MAFPKTYRTNAGWALSIGAILALFSNLRNEQRAVVLLAILGALGFLWSAWEHEWLRWNLKSIPRGLAILGLFFVIAWFVWPLPAQAPASLPAPPTQQSRLEIANIVGVHAQNKYTQHMGFFFNVFYENKGAIPVIAMEHRSIIVTSDSPLSPEEEDQQKKIAVSVPPPPKPTSGEEIQPGERPKRYFTAPQDGFENFEALARLCEANKKRIYIFVAMKYRDASLPDKEIRVTEFCGWFLGTFEMWHNCGNRVYTQTE